MEHLTSKGVVTQAQGRTFNASHNGKTGWDVGSFVPNNYLQRAVVQKDNLRISKIHIFFCLPNNCRKILIFWTQLELYEKNS